MSRKSRINVNRTEVRIYLNNDELELLSKKDIAFLDILPEIKHNEYDIFRGYQFNIDYLKDNTISNIDIMLIFKWKNKNRLRIYKKNLYNLNREIIKAGTTNAKKY